MIESIGLIGLVVFVLASFVVGGRLVLLATRTRRLPETAIGISLTLAGGVGTALLVVPMLVPDLAANTIYRLYQAAYVSNHVGFTFFFVFVWRVFRPKEMWAACLCAVSIAALLIGGIGSIVNMAPGAIVPGLAASGDVWFWMSLSARFVAYGWATFESFHYCAMLKRRLVLGLAEQGVVDRFFYWGVSNAAVFCIWVNTAKGALMSDSELARSVSTVVTALLGLVVAGSIFMAFFPKGRPIPEDQQTPSTAKGVRS